MAVSLNQLQDGLRAGESESFPLTGPPDGRDSNYETTVTNEPGKSPYELNNHATRAKVLDPTTNASHNGRSTTSPYECITDDCVDHNTVDLVSVISLQSLLNQFTHPTVRANFINGNFSCSGNPDTLVCIDELRWLLLPTWKTKADITSRSCSAAEHFKKLLSNSCEIIPIGSHNMTYAEWNKEIKLIASDKIWYTEQHCTHFNDSEASMCYGSIFQDSILPKRLSRSRTPKSVRIASSSENSSVEETSYSSHDSSEHTPTRHTQQRRRSSYDPRGVVTPPKFMLDGRQSLKEFLKIYESYFHRKYNGTEYDKSQELSNFLTGDLLGIYNALGGGTMKYKRIKEELLAHYKKLNINSKEFWRSKLSDAQLETGESIEVFGLRLQDLAAKSYPNDKKEYARQLRLKFLNSIPSRLSSRILEAEKLVKPITASKHLKFSSIVEMAKDLQKTSGEKSVTWTTSIDAQPTSATERVLPLLHSNRAPYQGVKQKTWSSKRAMVRPTEKPKTPCSYCNLRNHTREECWRAARLCLICGGKHSLKSCPKYVPKSGADIGSSNNNYGSRTFRSSNDEALA